MKVSLVTPQRRTRPGNDDMVWSYPKFADLSRRAALVQRTVALRGAAVHDHERRRRAHPRRSDGRDVFPNTGPRAVARPRLRSRRRRARWRGATGHPLVGALAATLQRRSGRRRQDDRPRPRAVRHHRRRADRVPGTHRPSGSLRADHGAAAPTILSEPQSHEFSLVARRRPRRDASPQAADRGAHARQARERRPSPTTIRSQQRPGAPRHSRSTTRASRRSSSGRCSSSSARSASCCSSPASTSPTCCSVARARGGERSPFDSPSAPDARDSLRLMLTESALLALLGGVASIAVAWARHARAQRDQSARRTRRRQRFGGLGAVTMSSVTLDWTALAFTLGSRARRRRALRTRAGASCDARVARQRHEGRRRRAASAHALGATRARRRRGRARGRAARRIGIDAAQPRQSVVDQSRLRRAQRAHASPDDSAGRHGARFDADVLHGDARSTARRAGRRRCIDGELRAAQRRMQRNEDRPHGSTAASTSAGMPNIGVHWATPTWFSTMRIPFKRGRMFAIADRAGAPKVVLVNETAARTLLAEWRRDRQARRRVAGRIRQGSRSHRRRGRRASESPTRRRSPTSISRTISRRAGA